MIGPVRQRVVLASLPHGFKQQNPRDYLFARSNQPNRGAARRLIAPRRQGQRGFSLPYSPISYHHRLHISLALLRLLSHRVSSIRRRPTMSREDEYDFLFKGARPFPVLPRPTRHISVDSCADLCLVVLIGDSGVGISPLPRSCHLFRWARLGMK
jgi:hypothetical protein